MATLNKNMLSPVGFNFSISRTPTMNFFVQSVSLPGVNLGFVEQPNPFKTLYQTGDHIQFDDITVSFKINEDLSNYIEIYDWIIALGFPENFDQYKSIKDQPSYTGESLRSDASLTILSSAMNPIVRIDIKDLFPVNLSPIEMNTRDSSIEYIEATAQFKFSTYSFNKL